MNCKEIIDNLEAYIQNDLEDNKKIEIEEHLKECSGCMEEYRQTKNTVETVCNTYSEIDIPKKLDSITITNKNTNTKKRFRAIKKAAIAVACVFALIFGIIFIPNSLFTEKVSAGDYRGGFNLAPVNFDATGVKPGSEFILESRNSIELEELESILSIDNEPAPVITKNGDNSFKIKPSRQLDQNRLYTFRIKSSDVNDITWTFQTSAVFKILGSFPGDKTADVPTNSGIEIYFSHEGFEDADKYFEISPDAEGSFERHKKAVVFVPKALKESTIYTVKVKKGLKLKGTDHSLSEDFVFQFETTATPNEKEQLHKGYFSYHRTFNEYMPDEKPHLAISYYVNPEYSKAPVKVKTSVYSYKDMNSFVNALKSKDSFPTWAWAYRNSAANTIPVDGLDKTLEFEQELGNNPKGEQFIKLPGSLPQGFYIVDSKWDDFNFQTFIQVTEVGMYILKGSNKTLVWLNDLSSKKPIDNAKISQVDSSNTFTTDADGLAYFDSPSDQDTGETNITYYKITTVDNKNAVLTSYTNYYRTYGEDSHYMYWNFIQLDRNLYKPTDTVNFWGMVKGRYSDEKIESLVIEVNQGYGYYYPEYRHYDSRGGKRSIGYFPMDVQPLVSHEIKATDGIFDSSFTLPNLDPGGYQLVVKKDDKVVVNSYITIENFIKPAYKLDVTKDKEAIFPGEEVNFHIKGSFFEGTGVPDLDVSYNINAGHIGDRDIIKDVKTDSTGSIDVKYVPKPSGDVQGEQYIGLYAHSVLPEMGEISGNTGIRLFVNDINVNLTSEVKDQKGTINAVVNKIVLDRINAGTAKDSMDYLGDAVNGKTLTGTIYKNTWIKTEDGEYYDYINKVTQKRYRYDLKTEVFDQVSMTTDKSGKASASFDAPDIDNGYYTAKIRCTDNQGRNMKFECYMGSYPMYYYSYEDNRYYLDGGKENYKSGEKVDVTFKKGTNTMPDGSYLFIKMQNGIRSYETKNNPNFSFIMDEKDIPNVYVTGVYFNGLTYVQSEEFNAVFDSKEKNLAIDAKLDKPSYKPGDEATVKITAKDKDGNPVKAVINTSIVDEALFKLNEQYIDTLIALYSDLPSGMKYSYQSHVNSGIDRLESSRGMGGDTVKQYFSKDESIMNSKAIKAPESKLKLSFNEDTAWGAADGETVTIREDFKDTAYFKNITLNDDGYGELKFRIPDNITSWRVTLSGVSPDLLAGSNKVSLNVTLPFFINYTLNSTYLVGDQPVLGATAYGNDLKDGEKVVFEAYNPENPGVIARAEGKAFERVNIPLWKLDEGKSDIVIRASSESGLKDSLKHTLNVVKTYHQIDEALYYDLEPDLKVEGGTSGNTKLIFTDKSRGMFLNDLNLLRYTYGNRIDQKLTSQIAGELIRKYFKQNDLEDSDSPVNISSYQRDDGGITILPYGDSDIDISAKLSSLIKDQINAFKLKDYFYMNLYDDSPGLKGNALYGLAVLREPVLLELDRASEVENAGIKDLLYIALAYCELGELPKAERIYTDRIASYVEELKPYFRINAGKDNDDILECTSLAAILASKLDKPQKAGFYQYCVSNHTNDILTGIERLLYINEEIEKAKGDSVAFSYTLNGKSYSKTLKDGESFTLTLPSVNISDFKVNTVYGDVSLVSLFRKPLTSIGKTDDNLTIERTYYSKKGSGNGTTTFKQDDIVKVVITWDIGAKAIDGTYKVTDFLPSGLKPINNPTSMGIDTGKDEISYRETDGQKVTFYVGNNWEKKYPLTYYARVISPGTYNADSVIIQSVASKQSLNVSDTDTIVIE